MNIFKKKESLIENITFMAIMAALNVIFVLLTTFIPFLLFLLVFILPLSCTLVMLLCQRKYFFIYVVSTIALCLIVTFWNISDTLFYIIPSMLTGSLFALLIEKKIPDMYSIVLCGILQTIISFLLVPLIKLITTVDILELYSSFFTFNTNEDKWIFLVLAVFFISLGQEIVSYLFIRFGLKKLGLNNSNNINRKVLAVIDLITILLMWVFVFINKIASICALIISIYFSIFVLINSIFIKKKLVYVLLIIGAVGIFFIPPIALFFAHDLAIYISYSVIGLYLIIISLINYK